MRELKKRTLDADLEAGDITQEEYDEKVKELEEQEAEDKAKEAKKKSKKGKNKDTQTEEIALPTNEIESSVSGVPTVDVINQTAMSVGEINAAEETEDVTVTDNKENENDSDNEGGKQ